MTRSIDRIVEEQVTRWRLEQADRKREHARAESLANVVAISAAHGTHGNRIAERVGQILELPVYDKEIVEHIASRAHVQVDTVRTLDERAQSRIDDYLTALLHERNFDQSDYLRALTKTITALGKHSPWVRWKRSRAHRCSQALPRRTNHRTLLIAFVRSKTRSLLHADAEESRAWMPIEPPLSKTSGSHRRSQSLRHYH
jgi:hypothetical protein